jgi:hypothetical protein
VSDIVHAEGLLSREDEPKAIRFLVVQRLKIVVWEKWI